MSPIRWELLAAQATLVTHPGRGGRGSMVWQPKALRLLSEVCLWHTPGWPPLPIRWVLVVDPDGRLPTQAFSTTDLNMAPARVVELFVQRWSLEVTFEEVRRHLGVEPSASGTTWRSHAPRRC